MKTYTFRDELFNLPWYFFYGGDRAVAHKRYCRLTKIDYEPCEYQALGECYFGVKPGAPITFGIWLPIKFKMSVLAHETNHAVNYVMFHKDISNVDHTIEVYAYYQEMIVRQILTKIKNGDRV